MVLLLHHFQHLLPQLIHTFFAHGRDQYIVVGKKVLEVAANAYFNFLLGVFLQKRIVVQLAVTVNFVEYKQSRFLQGFQFFQGIVDGADLIFVLGVRDVYHVQQNVTFKDFIEGRFKTFDEVVGQFADEPNGVGKQERHPFPGYFAHSGIQGRKKFIFGKNLGFAQEVHQGRLAYVGISHQRNPNQFTPVFALGSCLSVDYLELFFQQGDFVANDPAVRFNFFFPGATHPDTPALALQVRPEAP